MGKSKWESKKKGYLQIDTFIKKLYILLIMSNKVMIAVNPETKVRFRNLKFPDYIISDEQRIRFILDKWEKIYI